MGNASAPKRRSFWDSSPAGDCLSAKVDGALFHSNDVSGVLVHGIIGIRLGSDISTIQLTIEKDAGGTYAFGTQTDVTAAYYPKQTQLRSSNTQDD